MNKAMTFVGLAIVTAVAPIVVLIGSSPAHADGQNPHDPCSVEGASDSGTPQFGPVACQRVNGQLQWMPTLGNRVDLPPVPVNLGPVPPIPTPPGPPPR